MIAIRRFVVAVVALSGGALVRAATLFAQPPEQQGEFIPLDQLPPTEPFPAAPLLISAYAVVLVVLFLYLVSVARRLTAVQREVERLEADVKRTGRA
jgi:CcmD family protein